MLPRNSSRESNYASTLRNSYLLAVSSLDTDENSVDYSAADENLYNEVDAVHWYIKNNAKLHHTADYDLVHDPNNPKAVLRRGQIFYATIRFKTRDFDLKTDKIIINFLFGSNPSVSKGSMAVTPIANTKFTSSKYDWDSIIDPQSKGKDLVIQVYIPANALVGIWRLVIRSGLQDRSRGNKMVEYKEKTEMVVLFNPWCKEDLVYIDNDAKREEYVMNDKGKVYQGTSRRVRGRHWIFGQFDEIVLNVVFYLLEIGDFPNAMRGNPIKVVRAITCRVNDFYENGLLEGNWSGNYYDGVSPYKWNGSVRILKEYVKNGYSPVKFAQCWVYSGVTTTICRALGIPCRSVTNFISAHDTNASLTVDTFFDANGRKMDEGYLTGDSIWNFHVWNDVWMARPDLPSGYGGWQAIDSTPQEASDGKMQCGPASLEAVRKGDIGLGYDCPFVFSEVNADVIHWGEDEKSPWGYSRLSINKYHTGRGIVSRSPGDEDDFGNRDLDNIMAQYKNPEGSAGERLAIHNAIRGSERAQLYYDYKSNIIEDVKFELDEIEAVEIGDAFIVKINIRNESSNKRSIVAAATAKSLYYTGSHHSIIKKIEGNFILEPNKQKEIKLPVSYDEYWKRLQEQCMIKIYAICRVHETGQTWSEEDDFQVQKPILHIDLPSTINRGESYKVTFSFKNPLDVELTDGLLSLDGSGLLRPRFIKIEEAVPAGQDFRYVFPFRPRLHGKRKFVATFNSKELYDISGGKSVVVLKT